MDEMTYEEFQELMQKMEENPLPNVRFIRMEAENILQVFGEGEVSKIYLNFSDPWPKDRHAKRRLPSREFLNRYRVILQKKGNLEFKTDNTELFDFAVNEVEPAGWHIDQITYDLHNDPEMIIGNIMTEYEEKFSSIGNPINKYIIRPLEDVNNAAKTMGVGNITKEVEAGKAK